LKKLALIGNPNCGKTTLFNRLTGLNQKVGNYPGVTVDKRSGKFSLPTGETVELIDLPGAYSLSSNSLDEQVVQDSLLNPKNEVYPDVILAVIDATNLQRNLFLATQIHDLGIPMILVLNMMDVLEKEKVQLDIDALSAEFGCPVVSISAKDGNGISELKRAISESIVHPGRMMWSDFPNWVNAEELKALLPEQNEYQRFKVSNHVAKLSWLTNQEEVTRFLNVHNHNAYQAELLEISARYTYTDQLIKRIRTAPVKLKQKVFTERMDSVTTHPVWGLFTFLFTFFIVFQAVFSFATYPMDWIDSGMVALGEWTAEQLPEGMWNDFLVDGVIAGLGGVLVFIPQIMILFGLFTILEDTGYLARVSFMTDGLLRRFGMNGKSIVPLVGGFACAVPSIMAARTIENSKERLITIFITPLMSCSARLPVYVFLVSFIAPREYIWGFISLQGLVMMAMYLLGVLGSLLVALLLNRFLKGKGSTSFILELPNYRWPNTKNVVASMFNKGKTFVQEAGKIIVIAAMVLWALAYFGPAEQRERIAQKYETVEMLKQFSPEEIEFQRSSEELEYSYLGYIGKGIEPVIEPLGFDWKIGIALVASFAAREVFVGTMATIYSVEDNPDSEKGLKAIKFEYATAFSLLIFYVFALQCLSTVAIVKQETGGWKWPMVQLVSFTVLAYFASWLTYIIVA
jgi:ferrous iron transport protein B